MIETERLVLRQFRESDAEDVLEYENTMEYAILKREWEYGNHS